MGNKKRELDGKTKASLVKNFLFLLVYSSFGMLPTLDELFFWTFCVTQHSSCDDALVMIFSFIKKPLEKFSKNLTPSIKST